MLLQALSLMKFDKVSDDDRVCSSDSQDTRQLHDTVVEGRHFGGESEAATFASGVALITRDRVAHVA